MTDRNPDREPLIQAKGVGVVFGASEILKNVDLSVAPGEIVTVIGPNGAGKSTLVRAVLGLLTPSAGTVSRRAGIRVGYVPQTLHIERTMPITVRRFLAISRATRGADISEVMTEVGAPDLLDRDFQDLSGGEAKRVLLARALLNDPDLLVLDEPTANIDVPGQARFYDLIRAVRDRRDCGILLVSHDLHLVMAATDIVLCLNGHVCCQGTPEAVLRNPEYVALFGPELGRSFGLYTHEHDHDHDVHGDAVPHGNTEPHGNTGSDNAEAGAGVDG